MQTPANQTKAKDGRSGLIGKIHVAKNKLAVTDDSYRALLARVTGKDSCSAMTLTELEKVLAEFKRLGFKPAGKKRAGTRKQADSAQASMIRALWLDLYHLGAVTDPSEEAMAHFAGRVCDGLRALQWMSPYQADTIIKALRGWLKRIGFEAPVAAESRGMAMTRAINRVDHPLANHSDYAIAWKVLMIQYQMKVLSIPVTDDNKPIMIAAENLDAAIEAFGRSIRAMKAAQA